MSLFLTDPGIAAPRRLLGNHVPAAALASAEIGKLPANASLDLSLGLPLHDEAGLNSLLEQLYDPTSPLYHQFLTPEQFAEKFAPSAAEYEALVQYVQSKGMSVVHRHSNRLVLDVRGKVPDIEQTFATSLKLYRHPKEKRSFFAPSVNPSVDLAVQVLDIAGLDNFIVPRPMSLRPALAGSSPVANAGSAPGGSYRGNDFRAAYAPGVALTGVGQVVGLVEFDGYYANDITQYESATGLPNVPMKNILLNSFNGTAGANNAEVALDIEVAVAIAPGLAGVWVYEGTSANSILSRMATDNRAKQLSSSWTFGINATTENIFRQFASQGQTMFQASGDDGAYTGVVPTPADDPNVTVVGGTTLSTAAGAWSSETTWNWAPSGMGNSASSGGVSTSYAIPNYQKSLDMSINKGSTTLRNIPDVALTADDIWVVWDNGSQGAFGGTSAATPLWAGFMALVNQQALANGRTSVGFLNPTLYAIANGANYAACFHDITTGNNFNAGSPGKFASVNGYDLCTGWGTPAGQPLINALAGGTNLPPFFKSNPFTGPTANAGQPFSGSISNSAADANTAERLTFSKLSGPAWLTVQANGSLAGTPAVSNVGQNTFLVSVSESAGMSNTATMYVNVNGAPAFDSTNLFVSPVNAGQPLSGSISAQASDPNPGDQLRFTKLSGPAWLMISASGNLSGTAADSNAGTNVFTVTVSDQGGLSNNATLYINVNGSPYFIANPIAAPAVGVGHAYSGSLIGEAGDPNPGSILTFSKLTGPGWLSISPDGTLAGTPTGSDPGTNIFTVMVSDSGGLSGTAVMTIPVSPTPSVAAQLVIQSGQLMLNWFGGNPPFQIQISTNLTAGGWQNLGAPVTNRGLAVSPAAPAAAYRIQAAP